MNLIVSYFKITEDLGLWQVLNINKFTKFYALLIFVAQWWGKKGGEVANWSQVSSEINSAVF